MSDNFYYSLHLVSELMNDVLNPDFNGGHALGMDDDSGGFGHTPRPLNEGGNWLAMVMDVRRAVRALPWTGQVFLIGPEDREMDAMIAIIEFLGGTHPDADRRDEGYEIAEGQQDSRPVQERGSKKPRPTAQQGQWLVGSGGFQQGGSRSA